MSANSSHRRLAAAALLKMANATADADLAAHFVRLAADLKDQVGELAPAVSLEAPDVEVGATDDFRRVG